ncbi:methyltransferase domain-containing protein [Okeanomitos corallinicola TIOX110]|uniref:Methyltransferase domain-containing protein n=1 Tax=Okeanomitos corallinicola TIOX110 TaxID=3133117 RepID=A0ABZ2UW48_9CYAN
METNLVYLNYWQRKDLLKSGVPKFPVLRWWSTSELCEVEKVIFSKFKDRDTLLDVGAGDLKIMEKFQKAGYSGQYHTQDIGEEFSYNYQNLDVIDHQYDAILCLDVIEHLQLPEGLALIHKMVNLLSPNGVLILQTPNARCVRSPLISDMTHLHCYNLPDLWTYLTSMGLKVEGYRVAFERENTNLIQRGLELINKYIITRILGLDYADNIVIVAYKSKIIQ